MPHTFRDRFQLLRASGFDDSVTKLDLLRAGQEPLGEAFLFIARIVLKELLAAREDLVLEHLVVAVSLAKLGPRAVHELLVVLRLHVKWVLLRHELKLRIQKERVGLAVG